MKKLLMLILIISTFSSFGQEENSGISKEKLYEAKKQLRDGNKYYRTNRLEDAAIAYQKSMAEDGTYYKGAYNLGNAFFQQKKYKEAVEQYELANKLAKTKENKAKTSELIGDAYKKQNELEKALEAYKQALLKNPKDDILREKFVAAKKEKEKQDQQEKEDKENEDKDNKDDKDKKDDKEDKDKDNKDQDKKKDDKDKKDDKGKDKDDKKDDGDKDDKDKKDDKKNDKGDDKKDEKEQPAQPKESKLSPEQIQQLLESMNNEEQKTQKKVNAQKVKVKTNNNEKDW